MGRPRGGLTTGIHALANPGGRPVRLGPTRGQVRDGGPAAGRSGTVKAAHDLLADRADDSDASRLTPAGRGARADFRAMPDRVRAFPASDRLCHPRTTVERLLNEPKHITAAATRHDGRRDNVPASARLASIRIWLRSYESVI